MSLDISMDSIPALQLAVSRSSRVGLSQAFFTFILNQAKVKSMASASAIRHRYGLCCIVLYYSYTVYLCPNNYVYTVGIKTTCLCLQSLQSTGTVLPIRL